MSHSYECKSKNAFSQSQMFLEDKQNAFVLFNSELNHDLPRDEHDEDNKNTCLN